MATQNKPKKQWQPKPKLKEELAQEIIEVMQWVNDNVNSIEFRRDKNGKLLAVRMFTDWGSASAEAGVTSYSTCVKSLKAQLKDDKTNSNHNGTLL